jgi:hypothetical protein
MIKKPVLLPCGETVCAEHEELFRNRKTTKCQFCDKEHFLAESEHFLTNKAVEGFLAVEISRLDFGENYKNTANLLGQLNGLTNILDKMKKNPENSVFEKFQEMRRKVDLIREQVIQRVNDCSEKIIADINSYESECVLNLSKLNSKLELDKAFDLSGMKAYVREWEKQMNKLYNNEALCKEISEKRLEHVKSLAKIHKELNNKIF